MPSMTPEEHKCLEKAISCILTESVTDDYARYILEYSEDDGSKTIMEEIIDDVIDSSAWKSEGCYNDADIRFAIGRTLMRRLKIDV